MTRAARRAVPALAIVLLLAGRARAQDPPPEGCEPLTPASLDAVAARFELDAEQTAWLAAGLAARTLRRPEDLTGLPGAGPDLLAALESAWCWGGGTERDVQVAASYREAPRVETRARVAASWLQGDVRLLTEDGRRRVVRGGARVRAGAWSLRGGALAARRGLGLLLASAGAEPRGSGPRELRRGGWRTTTTLDPRVLVGGALGWERHGIALEAAHATEAEPPASRPAHRVDALLGSWTGRAHTAGFQAVRGIGSWSHGVFLGTRQGPGSWSAEAAWSEGGSAQGVSWFLEAERWKVRAGLRREGAGFLPVGAAPAAPAEDLVVWDLDAVWRGGPSRFLRAAVRSEREPEPGADFVRGNDRIVEVGERLRPGLSLVLSWRDRREAAGDPADAWRETTWRADLRAERRPWTLRARHEERRTLDALARHTELRVGRRGVLEWEGRAGFVSREGASLVLWGYARRAGGLYGWESLSTGARVGAWGGVDVAGLRFEMSADATPAGFRATASIAWRGGTRGALDPPAGPS